MGERVALIEKLAAKIGFLRKGVNLKCKCLRSDICAELTQSLRKSRLFVQLLKKPSGMTSHSVADRTGSSCERLPCRSEKAAAAVVDRFEMLEPCGTEGSQSRQARFGRGARGDKADRIRGRRGIDHFELERLLGFKVCGNASLRQTYLAGYSAEGKALEPFRRTQIRRCGDDLSPATRTVRLFFH